MSGTYKQIEGRNISASLNARPLVVPTVVDAEGRVNACTIAWVTSVSHDPALLACAIRPGAKTAQILSHQQEVVLNVLAAGQESIAQELGTKSGHTFDKHVYLQSKTQDSHQVDPPSLIGAVAHLECRLVRTVSTGDHTLFILEVVYAESAGEQKDNLLFSDDTLLMLQRDVFGMFQTRE